MSIGVAAKDEDLGKLRLCDVPRFQDYGEAFAWEAERLGLTVDEYNELIHEETRRANDAAAERAKLKYRKRKISSSKRTRIFCRDLHECQYCGARDKPLTIDHVIPESRGGTDDDDNLVTACKPCNSSKGAQTLEEWGRAL
jgi:5-methylcytosine-specific restriction endonuclease McrA